MMRRLVFSCFLILLGCATDEKIASSDIAVRWELVSNFIDQPGAFEARFTIVNNGSETLGRNWELFFNMAPRPILENRIPQPATLHHINGDWYKLVPSSNFSIPPGDSIDITYWGTEPVIKETDRPLGLYFVFDEDEDERIVEVDNYTFVPFTRPEQVNRGPEDEEPLPTPEWSYNVHQWMTTIHEAKLKKIIPTPVKVREGTGEFELSGNMEISFQAGLENEAKYLSKQLSDLIGNNFSTREGGSSAIQLRLRKGDSIKESYKLNVSSKGIVIEGSDAAGVFYGIQSLLATFPVDVFKTKSGTIAIPVIEVEDQPRFPFRGFHLDVSRNFQTKETIFRVLDILAFYKINHFLLYTTEDEGWRIEIEGLPELTNVGARRQHTTGKETSVLHPAYGSGPYPEGEDNYGTGYYTRADFIDILRYAKERHIKVIPELNFPAHARAAIKAMEARYEKFVVQEKDPEANQYRLIDAEDSSKYLSAQGYTDNVVSVAHESSFAFYEKVVDELSKMYREAGLVMDVLHAGGDEVPEGAWTASPKNLELLSQRSDIEDPKNLQAYFFERLLDKLAPRNLTVYGWEEVFLLKNKQGGYDPNPAFVDRNAVPFIWNNLFDYQDLGYRLANAGYKVVLCNVSNFYFDLAYSKDPKEPGLYWGGFVHTRDAWQFAPYDMFKTTLTNSMGKPFDVDDVTGKASLKPSARKNILGLEAQLWSETVKGRDMMEYYMLPKLIGFAESAWAAPREWETIRDKAAREASMDTQWNVFANTLAQRELPRLAGIHGGYNYRVPPPGAKVVDGKLFANTEYPGLLIRYTTDGSDPDPQSALYSGPVEVSGKVKVMAFDRSGGQSRPVEVR